MRLQSLFEEKKNLADLFVKFFKDRRDRMNFHVHERVLQDHHVPSVWYANFEIQFLDGDVLSFDEQAVLLAKLFKKEVNKLADEGRKFWLHPDGDILSWADEADALEVIDWLNAENIKKDAAEFLDNIVDRGARAEGSYGFMIMIPDSEINADPR